jgi:hypothetical protein
VCDRNRRRPAACVGEQLLGGLVQTDDGPDRIEGPAVDVEDIFHLPDECRIRLRGDHEPLLEPWLELVLLSVPRTVSYESRSLYSNSTMRLANKRGVQRFRPVGGSLHARAMRWASWSPSSRRERWFLGWRWASAASTLDRSYTYTCMLLLFDADGSFEGFQEVRGRLALSETGDSFATEAQSAFYDAAGNYDRPGSSSGGAIRMRVESPDGPFRPTLPLETSGR